MKKKQKQLAALLIVLVVLGAGLAGLFAWRSASEKAAADAEEAGKVKINPVSDVTEITFSSAASGGPLSFVYEDGAWHYADDPEFPLNDTRIVILSNIMKVLSAKGVYEEHDALSAYGLDPAQSWVEVSNAAGDTATVYVGTTTSSEAGSYYYCCVDGDPNVYTIATTLAGAVNYSLTDLMELETLPKFSAANVAGITLSSPTAQADLRVTGLENDTGGTDYTWSVQTGAGSWKDVTKDDTMKTLIADLGLLSIETCFDYNVSEDGMAAYGLAEPTAALTFQYTDEDNQTQTLTLLIGDTDPTGEYRYTRIQGSAMVNGVAASYLKPFVSLAQTGPDLLSGGDAAQTGEETAETGKTEAPSLPSSILTEGGFPTSLPQG